MRESGRERERGRENGSLGRGQLFHGSRAAAPAAEYLERAAKPLTILTERGGGDQGEEEDKGPSHATMDRLLDKLRAE